MSDHEPEAVDDSEILQDAFDESEGPMNVKNGGGWGPVWGALLVALATVVANHIWDSSSSRETTINASAQAIASLTTKVDDVAEQVKRLTEQPYVRRDEFDAQIHRMDTRMDSLEQVRQSRR